MLNSNDKCLVYLLTCNICLKQYVGQTVEEFNPLSANFIRWSNTLKRFVGKFPTSFFSVFDHFVGLALKGFSTYRTIKGAMVVNIKNMAHVCSNTFLSIFLRRDTIVFRIISLLHWLTKLTHQALYKENTIEEMLSRQWRHAMGTEHWRLRLK